MTRDQFPRNIFTQRQKQMIRLMLFLFAIYFLQAMIPTAASCLDLTFWNECRHFLLISPELVNVVDKSIKNHMWQLSQEFIPLSLCDQGLNLQTKEEVAGAIMQVYRNNGHLQHSIGNPKFQPTLLNREPHMAKLSEFVGKRSWLMFQLLEVDAAMWLEEPATHWSEIPSYVRFERLVKGMTLVS